MTIGWTESEIVDFELYDEQWWTPEDIEDWGWTRFPMLRGAVTAELAELADEQLLEGLWEQGFDAEELEGFMQVLGDIGGAIVNALPGIGTGAATGATVGSVVPGIGTGIGAAVGGVLGGLGSVLGQLGRGPRQASPQPPRPRPQPATTTVRPGVGRSPATTPSAPATQHPATAAPASAQTLLGILTNPQVIQALTAIALGTNGRESIEVAGRDIPTSAFAELVSELSRESMEFSSDGMIPEQYLAGEAGEAMVDLDSPADRAGGLIGLLAADAIGAEIAFEEPLISSPWEDVGDYEPVEVFGEIGVYGDGFSEDIYEVDEVSEGGPALIAVAGVIISGANLGLGVFDRLEKHVFNGSFEVNSHAASYIHNPSPRGLTVQTRTFAFAIQAHHPRYGIGSQTFWFRLTLEYDGFNIRRASIVEDRGRSSTLVSSDFKITFAPAAWSAPNEPVAAVVYNISGRWDPVGSGDESFDGRLIIDAQGRMPSFTVSSPQRWVWRGPVTQSGGGVVPRPTTARHTHTVGFDRPGKTTLTEAETRSLHAFYQGLPSAVRDEIAAGRLSVRVTGRASTTATVERNQTIGRQRAASVAQKLKEFAGTAARIEIAAHGELGARTRDNQEDPAERRADVLIEYSLYR